MIERTVYYMAHKQVRFESLRIGAKFYYDHRLCVKIAKADDFREPSYVEWSTGKTRFLGKDWLVRPVRARVSIIFRCIPKWHR